MVKMSPSVCKAYFLVYYRDVKMKTNNLLEVETENKTKQKNYEAEFRIFVV